MSFRIHFTEKENVFIALIVVRNCINFHFESSDKEKALEIRKNLKYLTNYVHNAMNIKQTNLIRGEDPEHIKRHHISEDEVHTAHLHLFYENDVTPEQLEHVLFSFLKAQEIFALEKYQFVDAYGVALIRDTFREFHLSFHNSSREKEFLNERKLLVEEKHRLAKEATSHCTLSRNPPGLSASDIRELEESGITIRKRKLSEITTTTVSDLLAFSIMSPNEQSPTPPLTKKPRHETHITQEHPLAKGMKKMLSNTSAPEQVETFSCKK